MFMHPPHYYLFVGNCEVWRLGSFQQLCNIHNKFKKNQLVGPTVGMGTDLRTNTRMHVERQTAW
jgi:hypothetical protein